ncbi:MAG TPA: hypothetical protein ENI39_01190 [Anaerolineae bacterium]|nr:hypothetical protein [Anaerolineae bacterium]
MDRALRRLMLRVTLAMLCLTPGFLLVSISTSHALPQAAELPDWVEPRGLNITDLVGQVPDELLQGMIISFRGGEGLVQFESSADLGDTLVITTTIRGRKSEGSSGPVTTFGCLGQFPVYDNPGNAAPPSVMRLYTGGEELNLSTLFRPESWYTPATLAQPLYNTKTYSRYPVTYFSEAVQPDGLHIPANMGCRLRINGDFPEMTGVFTVPKPTRASATVLGTQQGTFHSYIGVGDVGHFQPLMNQLRSKYGSRHERITLSIPGGSNYVLIIVPPMPGQVCYNCDGNPQYCRDNEQRHSAGTMRLEGSVLSVDLTHHGAFPLDLAWQDADLSGNSEFLPTISPLTRLAAPEYILPPGIAWNGCYTLGNCSNSVLQAIYDAEATLTLVYLRVSMPYGNIDVLPVKVAGPGWSAAGTSQREAHLLTSEGTFASLTPSQTLTHTVYLPIILRYPPLTGCPCGIFNEHGQMIWLSP